jgi:alpha-D-ribose 1-methylphosphonate 5-triphosphate synthase subunit PhnI
MGYVAVSGGKESIENAENFMDFQRFKSSEMPISVDQIKDQLHFLVDRVMGEGSLYAPDLAALAIKQSAGDTFEAAFMIRAYRTTLPRLSYSLISKTEDMRIIRRISSAFKEIPGGQILGPTPDYTLRLLDFSLFEEDSDSIKSSVKEMFERVDLKEDIPDTFQKVVELLRRENLIVGRLENDSIEKECFDITRESLDFPASRSAAMQTMARGETGGMLALAYSNMRGYGNAHPTIGELRVGYMPVYIKHPYRETPYFIGEILVTEAEVISEITKTGGLPKFALGYGLCFGHNETKAISMATLDRAMQTKHPEFPSEDQEFVLYHIDGIESMGFANHFKLPHYVTFQSDLDRLRNIHKKTDSKKDEVENGI